MSKYKFLLSLILFSGLSLFGSRAISADQIPKLVIKGADFRTTPIAIDQPVSFGKVNSSDAKLSRTLSYRIKRAFLVSGAFKLVDFELRKGKKEGSIASLIDFDYWSSTGSEIMLKTGFSNLGKSRVKIEFRLFDVKEKKELLKKKYTVKRQRLRDAVFEFTDRVYQMFTGQKSNLFSTIVFPKKLATGHQIIYRSYIDGSGERPISEVPKNKKKRKIDILPSISRNAKLVLFTSYINHQQVLLELDLFSGKVARVSADRGLNMGASYSPDNRKVALTMSKDGNSEIYVLDRKSGKKKRLTNNFSIDISPIFSPDGKKLCFVSEKSGKPQLYVMDVDGKNQKRISFNGIYNQTPSWSPDQKYIAFTSRDERRMMDIYLLKTDDLGAPFIRLTQDQGNNMDPVFGPNGNQILFRSNRSGSYKLYIMNLDGSGQVRVSQQKGSYRSPDWSGWTK